MELIRDDLLGWHPFRNLLARFAATPPGQDRARALMPHHALTTVRTALRETTEARRALAAEGPPPWDGTGDARPILAEAAPAGAVLDGPALVLLGRGLAAAARLRAYGQRIAAVAPGLGSVWADLPAFPDLAGTLHEALDPDGRLTDRASPRLRALRRQITTLRAELQARVERLLDHPAVLPALQERYVTLRNGRYVIPVRDDARRAVRGIIHDRSQSGATRVRRARGDDPAQQRAHAALPRGAGRGAARARGADRRRAARAAGPGGARRGARRPRSHLCPRHPRRAAPRLRARGGRRRRSGSPRGPASAAGRPAVGALAGRGRCRPDRPPGAGRSARPGPERPERGRQDRRARNGRPPRAHGAGRVPHSGRTPGAACRSRTRCWR